MGADSNSNRKFKFKLNQVSHFRCNMSGNRPEEEKMCTAFYNHSELKLHILRPITLYMWHEICGIWYIYYICSLYLFSLNQHKLRNLASPVCRTFLICKFQCFDCIFVYTNSLVPFFGCILNIKYTCPIWVFKGIFKNWL